MIPFLNSPMMSNYVILNSKFIKRCRVATATTAGFQIHKFSIFNSKFSLHISCQLHHFLTDSQSFAQ